MTETMTGPVVTVLQDCKLHGGTIFVPTQTSMGCIYLDGQSSTDGITWYYFNATAPGYYTLRYSDMKLRRSG